MKHGPLVFLAAFSALSLSWFGFVLTPQVQLGGQQQATNLVTMAELYPQARPGLAQQGEQVYRANGCYHCHTRQVVQTGTRIDLALVEAGTNAAALAEALRQLGAEEAGPAPKTILRGLSPDKANASAQMLRQAGARAEARIEPVGADIARGWGQRQAVARDYLFDGPVMLGWLRAGPDLANVGGRLPDAGWHWRHLYLPQAVVPGSLMPRYPYLFEERRLRPGERLSPEAIPLTGSGALLDPGGDRGAVDREAVPRPEARALVAYLLSLKTDAVLYETPMSAARRAGVTPTNNVAERAVK